MVIGARRAPGLNASQHITTTSSVASGGSQKEKISSEQQFVGSKCIVDARGQRSERTELLASAKIILKLNTEFFLYIFCCITLVPVCLNVQNFEDVALE